jgi:regulator of replication initiation timing
LAHTRDIQRRYNELVLKGISDRTEYEKEILNRMEIRDDPLEERRKQVEKIVKLLRDEATQLEFQGRLTEALRKRNEALNLEKEKGKTKLSLGQEILLAGDGRASIESFLKSKFNVAKVYEGSFNINKEQLGRDLAQSTIDTLKNILDTSKMSSLSSGNIDKLRTALIDTVVDVMNKVLGK